MSAARYMTAVLMVCSGLMGTAGAQDTMPAPLPPVFSTGGRPAPVALQVQVVLSRWQGDKKLSSLPFSLTLSTDGTASKVSVGSEVPVRQQAEGSPISSYNYRHVGTNIDCRASIAQDGRFGITVMIDDSSLSEGSAQAGGNGTDGLPSFQSYRSQQTVLLKDGQSVQYTTATDRITGGVMKADVTLKVLK